MRSASIPAEYATSLGYLRQALPGSSCWRGISHRVWSYSGSVRLSPASPTCLAEERALMLTVPLYGMRCRRCLPSFSCCYCGCFWMINLSLLRVLVQTSHCLLLHKQSNWILRCTSSFGGIQLFTELYGGESFAKEVGRVMDWCPAIPCTNVNSALMTAWIPIDSDAPYAVSRYFLIRQSNCAAPDIADGSCSETDKEGLNIMSTRGDSTSRLVHATMCRCFERT